MLRQSLDEEGVLFLVLQATSVGPEQGHFSANISSPLLGFASLSVLTVRSLWQDMSLAIPLHTAYHIGGCLLLVVKRKTVRLLK